MYLKLLKSWASLVLALFFKCRTWFYRNNSIFIHHFNYKFDRLPVTKENIVAIRFWLSSFKIFSNVFSEGLECLQHDLPQLYGLDLSGPLCK